MNGDRYTIGQVSRRTGLAVRTIRFYSDEGVVAESERSESGYRLYDSAGLQRLELARMSDEERQAIIDEFLDHVFDGLEVDPAFAERIRRGRPDLPDDPTPEQVEAWIELAELVRDEDFRRSLRSMAERQAGERAASRDTSPDGGWNAIAQRVLERAGGALEAGVDPASPQAQAVVDELAPAFAPAAEADGPEHRARLAERLAAGTDPRAERYWQLLSKINGWAEIPTATPAWEWLAAALRARSQP
jgi:DNA-binding transcriptional MerR regulator